MFTKETHQRRHLPDIAVKDGCVEKNSQSKALRPGNIIATNRVERHFGGKPLSLLRDVHVECDVVQPGLAQPPEQLAGCLDAVCHKAGPHIACPDVTTEYLEVLGFAKRWVAAGIWDIPTEHREKGNAGALVLPAAALAVIKGQERIDGNLYVFAGRGGGYFRGFSPRKRAFDKKVGNLPRWTIHDLRRTARSLMSRAGVRPEVAEKVMGHTLKGVEGVYDRHQYLEEKAEALRRLAALIKTILNPPAENVTHIRREGAV